MSVTSLRLTLPVRAQPVWLASSWIARWQTYRAYFPAFLGVRRQPEPQPDGRVLAFVDVSEPGERKALFDIRPSANIRLR